VLRAIFRACYEAFQRCGASQRIGVIDPEKVGEIRPEGLFVHSNPAEEFRADFDLVSRRVLGDADYRLFRYHFLHGAPWRACCEKLHMDRVGFFRAVYRIEEKLGRAFAELRPYPLYPTREYFYSRKPTAMAA
jgi:hypothetical protein